jgi:hypothetical protein
MKTALIAAAVLVLLAVFVLPKVLFPYARHGSDRADLYPPFLAPRPSGPMPAFADVKRKVAEIDAARRSDRCVDAAYTAAEKNLDAFDRLAKFGGFMKCYVGELELYPRRVCAEDKRAELARYTRGYFYELGFARKVSQDPALKGRLELPPKIKSIIDPKSDIVSGHLDFTADPSIIDGWKQLIKVGVVPKDKALRKMLRPEVPRDVIQRLSAVPVLYQYCQ